MNKENCALKLVNEIILYYDARSKKHQKSESLFHSETNNESIIVRVTIRKIHCNLTIVIESCT